MRPPLLRRLGAVLALALAATLLAGCTSIPVSGPVVLQTPKAANDPGGLAVEPNPPADGAAPDEIVRGFVLAATAGGDYSVAKKFLTSAFAAQWDPYAQVLVHDRPWTPTVESGGRVVLDVHTSAVVQRNGSYSPSSQHLHPRFQLQQVRGQWRIAKAPDGVLLAQAQFQSGFQPEALQFFDPTYSRLVPDIRWFQNRGDLPQRLLRAMLSGPAGPISGGVTASAFPSGTTLGGVSESGGITTVAMTVPGAMPSRTVSTRMQQQLGGTLRIAPRSLQLLVNGATVPLAKALAGSQPDLQALALVGGRFGSVTGDGVREDALLGKRIAALRPTAITVSDRQRFAAVLDPAGRAVLVQPSGDRVVDSRPLLTDPGVDQHGWVWTVPADDPAGLVATSTRGTRVDVRARLAGTGVDAIEVSPDGSRLLVLVQTGSGALAYVLGIERNAAGVPTGLSTSRYPVAVSAEVGVDATWVDDSSVAVLTSDAGGQTVTVQQLGGLTGSSTRLANATAIVGTSSGQYLRALLQNGTIAERSGNVWQPESSQPLKASVLAVQR